ncbi:MAG: AMP-binding protein, partial [Bdellovibrionales bacterium]|nr:AMP-binding protein [Bdellovibrionales bacterium]
MTAQHAQAGQTASLSAGLKWQPDPDVMAQTALASFMAEAGVSGGYAEIWQWSTANRDLFWARLWDFCGVIGDRGPTVFAPGAKFQEGRFFPDSKINFAENLLRRRDDALAIVFRGEDKVERKLTFRDLYDAVSRLRQALAAAGVTAGDRVAGYMPNMPETVIAMLAATSLGAIWSSASPDFGVQGVLDRFGQIEPKVVFCVDGYYYGGKEIDCRDKIRDVLQQLP